MWGSGYLVRRNVAVGEGLDAWLLLMPSEMKRLKVLEKAHGRLKKLVADVSFDELCDGSCKVVVVVILPARPLHNVSAIVLITCARISAA